MEDRAKTFGYYHVTVRPTGPGRLLQSNNERAFIIAQLQDFLSPRLLLAHIPAHAQLASCIDLLAFSVRDTGIDLLLFTIDKPIAMQCIKHLLRQLAHYQSGYRYTPASTHLPSPLVYVRLLSGPHQALAASINIHLLHHDWEFDRYSSIGFYLHDRRGDWMRTWRLTTLYENNPKQYELLMAQALTPSTTITPTTLRFAA